MTNFDEKFWFVPPYLHRRNTAERAIETFKNHFIDGISSVNKDFPMHIWFRLILQACLALNLLRQSRINPKISSYAQVHGAYYFNVTPVAPPGARVVVSQKTSSSWNLGNSVN